MAIDPGRVKALFQAAIERADPAERRAFLDGEVGGDTALRDRLDALLAAHDCPSGALDLPFDTDLQATISIHRTTGDFTPESPGNTQTNNNFVSRKDNEGLSTIDTLIAGRYKIRHEIGEGGMGSVYLAEQMQPVKRMVALKLIKPGMDSRTVLARFDSERQALAMMDHPHIAKVLDAGTTEAGRPFFVMELVQGIPLTHYCDRHKLGLPDRLAIFRQICSAVQHAHQKGIIHRDLKPTNILVESHDGHPVPKVIDFGLAKATSGMKLTDQSLFSAFGGVAGTPLYMAPEQAGFNALDVDTRADIYALGVILYELLTGSTPIRRDTFQRAALDEMLRVIREVEPPTPSSRLSESDALAGLAANRNTEPARLSRFVRGDLDWIVMKALAKERQRRYDSAIELARDVERFLNHEPVSAGPPSATYRFRKFVRRNRPHVVAASLVLLALVGGIVGTTIGLIEARRQREIAIDESKQKDLALIAEATQRRRAGELQQRAERREAIAIELVERHDKARQADWLLWQAEPRRVTQYARPMTFFYPMRESKQKSGSSMLQMERIQTQIEKADEILRSIFRVLTPMNAENEVKPPNQEELANRVEDNGDPLATARIQFTLGQSLLGQGYPEKAIEPLKKCRATFDSKLGGNHPDTFTSIASLALAYQAAGQFDKMLFELAPLRSRRAGSNSSQYVGALASLGLVFREEERKRSWPR